jgi:hypothetical protein
VAWAILVRMVMGDPRLVSQMERRGLGAGFTQVRDFRSI